MASDKEKRAWFEENRKKYSEKRSNEIKADAEAFDKGHSRFENNGEYVCDNSYDVDDMLAKFGHILEFLPKDENNINRQLGMGFIKILNSLKDAYHEDIITKQFISEIEFEEYETPSQEYTEYFTQGELFREKAEQMKKHVQILQAVTSILNTRFLQSDSKKRIFTNQDIANREKMSKDNDELIDDEYILPLLEYAKSLGLDSFTHENLSGGNLLGDFSADRIKIDIDDVNIFKNRDFISKFTDGGADFTKSEIDYAEGEYKLNVEPYFGKKQLKMLAKANKNVFDCILINGRSMNELYPEYAEIEDKKEREDKLKLALLFQSRLEDSKIEYVFPMQKEDKTVFSNPVPVESDYLEKYDIARGEMNANIEVVKNHVRKNALGIKVDNSDLYNNIVNASEEYRKASTDEEKTQKAELLKKACSEYLEKRKNPITSDGKTRFNNISNLYKSVVACEKERIKSRDNVILSAFEIDRLSEMILISEGKDLSDVVDKSTLTKERRAAENKAAKLLYDFRAEGKKEGINEILSGFKKNILEKGYDGMESVFSKIDTSLTPDEAAEKKKALFEANSKYIAMFERLGQRLDNRSNESFYFKQLLFTSEEGRKVMTGYVGVEQIALGDLSTALKNVGLNKQDRMRSVYFNSKMFRVAKELSKLPEEERNNKIKEYAKMDDYFNANTSKGCVKDYYDEAVKNPLFSEGKLVNFPDDASRDKTIAMYAEPFKLARQIAAEYEIPDIFNPNEFKAKRQQIASISALVIECSQNEEQLRKLGKDYFRVYDSEHKQKDSGDLSEIHESSFKESDKHMGPLQVFAGMANEIDDSMLINIPRKNYFVMAAKKAYGEFCKESGKLRPGMKATELDPDYFDINKYLTFYVTFTPKLSSMDFDKIKNYLHTGEHPSADFMDIVKNHMKENGLVFKDTNVKKTFEKESEVTDFAKLTKEEGEKTVKNLSKQTTEASEKNLNTFEKK